MSNNVSHDSGELRAVVRGRVGGEALAGYFVTYPHGNIPEELASDIKQKTSITFSTVDWEGENPPQGGQVVILSDIHLHERGWRATRARPVTPGEGGSK